MNATDIVTEIRDELGNVFDVMTWAESEIAAAQRRHPEQADKLWHSFSLLRVQDNHAERVSVEIVYRAHAREILERVARDADTRPATAAEVVVGLLATAELAPLSHEGFALAARMWQLAGLPDNDGFTAALPHVEALSGDRLDREETEARRKCGDPARTLGTIECNGQHHGQHVACTFAAAPALFTID